MFYSVSDKSDFERVAKNGQPFFATEFGFKIIKNNLSYNRYGIVISTTIDKRAVVRNKIRRRIKESIILYDKDLKKGFDLMFLVRESVKELNFSQIKAKIEYLFKKARLFL